MAVGREFGESWRLEGEMFWRQADPDDISVGSATFGEFDVTEVLKTTFETGGEGGGPAFVVGGGGRSADERPGAGAGLSLQGVAQRRFAFL